MTILPAEFKENHDSNAVRACQELGLDVEAYAATFERISEDWGRTLGTTAYLAPFIRSSMLTLCKSPEDFTEASKIILEGYLQIYNHQDGSWDFGQVVIEELKAGRITTMGELKNLCDKLVTDNAAFRTSKEGQDPMARNGTQFHRFAAEIRARLEQV